jgi:superfamily II DNA or RNA helicase
VIEPREYQKLALERTREAVRLHGSVVIVAPTGSGKTVIAAMILQAAVAKGSKCLIIAHRREIILQTATRFTNAGLDTAVIMAGLRGRAAQVQVAAIQTLARRPDQWPEARVVIVDEAHHSAAATYSTIIEHYRNRKAAIIGLSATPERLDGRGLKDVGFRALVQVATAPELMEQGHLMRPKVFAPPAPVWTQRTRAGDFTAESLADYASKLQGRVVDHYLQRARGRKGVVFACNVAHSLDLRDRFRAAGVRIEHIDANTSRAERDHVLAKLRAGELDLVTNVALLDEGVDIPDLEVAILARPTKSLTMHRQQCGRILRPAPNKVQPIILDHANNTELHGPPWFEPEWCIDSISRTKRDSGEVIHGVRFCPECFATYTPPCSECVECGAQLQTTKQVVESAQELVDIEAAVVSEAVVYADLLDQAWTHNPRRKLGWAAHRFNLKFGHWPRLMHDVVRKHYPCTEHVHERVTKPFRSWTRCAMCLVEIRRPGPGPGPGPQ